MIIDFSDQKWTAPYVSASDRLLFLLKTRKVVKPAGALTGGERSIAGVCADCIKNSLLLSHESAKEQVSNEGSYY